MPGVPRRWIVNLADWTNYAARVDLLHEFLSPTISCSIVEGRLLAAVESTIPRSSARARRPYCHCWWTPACTEALRAQRQARTRYRRRQGDLDLWIQYKRLRAVFRSTVRTAKTQSWTAFISTLTRRSSSSKVWNEIGRLRASPPPPPILLRQDDTVHTSPASVAHILARDFSARGNMHVNHLLPADPQPNVHSSTEWYNHPFLPCELSAALRATRPTSPGPDYIHPAFLTHLPPPQLSLLLQFFNKIWETGFPHQWRSSIILPFIKPGKPPRLPSSYRPIALTSALCKTMERMVNTRLTSFLERNRILDPHQSGFHTRHSSLDALLRLDYRVRLSLIRGEHVACIFLDITQAFDSVQHHLLLRKLRLLNLDGNMLCFMTHFLNNRKIQVRVSDIPSPPHLVQHGVPQGSVLSPTLFSIMLDGIFHSCSHHIEYSMFADDCALWTSGTDMHACIAHLQSALDAISEWSDTWGLNLSVSKMKAMVFTRSNTPPPPLHLHNTPLDYTPFHKFLGIIFDHRYTFKHHIHSLRDRCSKDLRILRIAAGSGWGADLLTLRKLYESLIRSKLDYASFLFFHAAPSHLLTLDRIQYAAIRTIIGAHRCTPVALLEAEASLMPLRYSRQLLLSQYIARTLSVPLHPVRQLFLDYYPYHFYRTQPLPFPALGVAFDELSSANLTAAHIPTYSPLSAVLSAPLSVHMTLHTSSKSSLTDSAWRSLFADLLTSYSDRTAIYCDGSRAETRSGSGVSCSTTSIMARISDHSSVLSAELYAIYVALTFFSTAPGRYVMFSDSLSSLSAICHAHSRSHFLVHHITSFLSASDKFLLEWVPAHVGNEGNERADQLARSALDFSQISTPLLSSHESRQLLRSHHHSLWQTHWSETPSRLLPVHPTLTDPPHHTLSRRHQVVITRLRLGTCKLTHNHYLARTPPSTCPTCQTPWTISHLVLHCPDLYEARAPLAAACRSIHRPLSLWQLCFLGTLHRTYFCSLCTTPDLPLRFNR